MVELSIMSITPSNVYAEKAFAQNPTALWALDEDFSFINACSPSGYIGPYYDPNSWQLGNASYIGDYAPNYINSYGSYDFYYNFSPYLSQLPGAAIQALGSAVSITIPLNSGLSGYSPLWEGANTISFDIAVSGFTDIDYVTGSVHSNTFSTSIGYVSVTDEQKGIYKKLTFNLQSPIPVGTGTDLKLSIQVYLKNYIYNRIVYWQEVFDEFGNVLYYYPIYEPVANLLTIRRDSISLGKDAYELMQSSSGMPILSLFSISAISNNVGTGSYYLNAQQYGGDSSLAFYNLSSSSNSAHPLVYGSKSSTKIDLNETYPAVVFDGNGLLSNFGKDNTYTLEFWTRINQYNTTTYQGAFYKNELIPLVTDSLGKNGIFIKDRHIIVRVGNSVGSYFASSLNRPMLMNLVYTKNSVKLLINSETVINISISETDKDSLLDFNNKGRYLHFGGHKPQASTLQNIVAYLDCISVYQYEITEIEAKSKFIMGQAVDPKKITNLHSNFGGSTVEVSFKNAGYDSTYVYPESAPNGSWSKSDYSNLDTTSHSLSTKKHALPTIVSTNGTSESLYLSLMKNKLTTNSIEDSYSKSRFCLIPSLITDDATEKQYGDAFIKFDHFRVTDEDTRYVYGIFDSFVPGGQNAYLITISDRFNNYFAIKLTSQNKLSYVFSYGSSSERILANIQEYPAYSDITYTLPNGNQLNPKTFFAGIDIQKFQKYALSVNDPDYDNFRKFFSSQNNLSVFFGKNPYASASNQTNVFYGYFRQIAFGTSKTLLNNPGHPLNNYIGTTGLLGDHNYIPISTYFYKSYMSDYVLFYNNRLGILDIGQAGYWQDTIPLSAIAKTGSTNTSAYAIDFLQFHTDYKRSDEYTDQIESVKTYISFVNNYSGPITNTSSRTKVSINSSDVVSPGTDWKTNSYEVIDGSIIYLPADIDIKSHSIVIHSDFYVDGIHSADVSVKWLGVSSKALDQDKTKPNYINTKNNVGIVPFATVGSSDNYKARVPYSIDYLSTPYLYQTKTSGIKLKDYGTYTIDGQLVEKDSRGIRIPLNDNFPDNFITMVSSSIMVEPTIGSGGGFSPTPSLLFRIKAKGKTINFYIKGLSTTKGTIYADTPGNIMFYVNGVATTAPIIEMMEWTTVAIMFLDPLNVSDTKSSIELISRHVRFDNIIHFAVSKSINVGYEERLWSGLTYDKILKNSTQYSWDNWSTGGDWFRALNTSSTSRNRLSPSDLFNIQTGTHKIIAGDIDTEKTNSYAYPVVSVSSNGGKYFGEVNLVSKNYNTA